MSSSERRLELLGLMAVLVIAALARLQHFGSLLPWFLFEDELRTTTVAIHLLRDRTLDPQYSLYPGVPFYINAAVCYLWAAAGMGSEIIARGLSAPLDRFAGATGAEPEFIYLSRWVSLLFGLGTIAVSHLLFRMFLSWRWALFATLLLGLNTMHIYMSWVAKVDSINAFWFSCGFLTGLVYYRRGGTPWIALTAAFAALSVMTKNNYQLWIGIFFLLAFRLWRGRRFTDLLKHKDLWAAAAVLAGVSLLSSPYTFVHIEQTAKVAGWLYRHAEIISTYHTDPHVWWLDRYFYLLSVVFPFCLGLPLFWVSVGGTAFHIRKYAMKDPFIAYNLIWYVYIVASGSGGPAGGSFPYYLFLAVLPLFMLMAADGLSGLASAGLRPLKVCAYLLCGLVLVWSLLKTDSYYAVFMQSHDDAGPWIQENIGAHERVLLVSVYEPAPALGVRHIKSVWPHEFDKKMLADYDPDVIVIDAWLVAGFRKVYRELWVAPWIDSLVRGDHGHEVIKTIRPDYFMRPFYAALDPEHDVELIFLRKTGGTGGPEGGGE